MLQLRNSLLVLMIAVGAMAQTASQKPSVDVRRVGARLKCRCGCPDSVATCSMLECSFSKPAKEEIAQKQSQGMPDQEIIKAFVAQYGSVVFLDQPSALGWIVPYSLMGAGALACFIFIRKYYR